ncbi:MAG TPA: AI-2E family transporter [Gemmatimonadales bacterium]|jgi:predicted PurR-regulated permease PerM|nr:AI-2E family transporter [Gemmatimonadales bacterium]
MLKSWAREQAIAVTVIASLAVVAALYLARELLIPVAAALTFNIVLRPVVRWLEGARIPAPAGAAIVVLGAVGVLVGAGYGLAPSIEGFLTKLPAAEASAHNKASALPPPFDRFGAVFDGSGAAPVQSSMHAPPDSSSARPASSAAGPSASSPVIGRVFGTATSVIAALIETLLLLMFFLAAGDMWRQRLIKLAPTSAAARRLAAFGDEVQTVLARYLGIATLLNIGQGLVFTGVATVLHLPAPPVWGILTFCLEFIPYLGGLVMVVLLLVIGWAGTGGISHALLPPICYLVMTTIQNDVVSPVTYGRQLQLNPAAILISTMTWWFLWGVPGAFLSVPILAVMKIFCDRGGERLAPVAALIAG